MVVRCHGCKYNCKRRPISGRHPSDTRSTTDRPTAHEWRHQSPSLNRAFFGAPTSADPTRTQSHMAADSDRIGRALVRWSQNSHSSLELLPQTPTDDRENDRNGVDRRTLVRRRMHRPVPESWRTRSRHQPARQAVLGQASSSLIRPSAPPPLRLHGCLASCSRCKSAALTHWDSEPGRSI